jgi:hypothetical protein
VSDIGRDDIKAMRKEGSLRDYLRLQMAEGQARKSPAKPTPAPRPPGHAPGAWPAGSRPPSPLPAQPPGAWMAALQRDRVGTQTGTHCECPGCTTPSQPHTP